MMGYCALYQKYEAENRIYVFMFYHIKEKQVLCSRQCFIILLIPHLTFSIFWILMDQHLSQIKINVTSFCIALELIDKPIVYLWFCQKKTESGVISPSMISYTKAVIC